MLIQKLRSSKSASGLLVTDSYGPLHRCIDGWRHTIFLVSSIYCFLAELVRIVHSRSCRKAPTIRVCSGKMVPNLHAFTTVVPPALTWKKELATIALQAHSRDENTTPKKHVSLTLPPHCSARHIWTVWKGGGTFRKVFYYEGMFR